MNIALSPVAMCVIGLVCLAAGVLLLLVWRALWRFLFGSILVIGGACACYAALSGVFGLPALPEFFFP